MKVFFDGGCHPNPGPMEAAVVIRGAAHVRIGLGTGDNNQAEWLALLFALELATAAGMQDVTFIGDSTLVVEQARGRWRCTSPQLEGYLAAFRRCRRDRAAAAQTGAARQEPCRHRARPAPRSRGAAAGDRLQGRAVTVAQQRHSSEGWEFARQRHAIPAEDSSFCWDDGVG